eukprot:SAG31_NODE_1390_length_8539_cov_12.684834_7_plen_63_part_00
MRMAAAWYSSMMAHIFRIINLLGSKFSKLKHWTSWTSAQKTNFITTAVCTYNIIYHVTNTVL